MSNLKDGNMDDVNYEKRFFFSKAKSLTEKWEGELAALDGHAKARLDNPITGTVISEWELQ